MRTSLLPSSILAPLTLTRSQHADLALPFRHRHSDPSEATPSSLGHGVHGAPAGEEARGLTHEDVGRHKELDGEQMRASGEGDVASVVDRKPGATGGEGDLASDLDRKKAEQAPAREQRGEERRGEVDVQAVLKDRRAPAGTAS